MPSRDGHEMRSIGIATALLYVISIGVLACAEGRQMERTVIGKDARSFALESSGKVFSPRGFNYDRDYKMRLLEDYWENEWTTVEQDFAEMKQLGANVVRIHLQFGRFMRGPNEPNPKALDRLGKLVELAERTGLYLDLTGLACYRKSEVPAWYDALGEKARWRAQAAFWEAVSARCAGSPAIFCYDLMNEPVVPADRMERGSWLTGELGGFCYVQYISLDQPDRSRPDIAREWIRTMTQAIRKRDKKTLITVGLVDWSLDRPGRITSGFDPKTVAPELDFLCVHLYPESNKLADNLATLKAFCVGKPVVIEETFPMHCTVPELAHFLQQSQDHAAGWIGFYWGKTLTEYRKSDTIPDKLMAEWLKWFVKETGGLPK